MQRIFTTLIFTIPLCIIALTVINLTLTKNPHLIKTRISFFLFCLGFISIKMFLPLNFPFTYGIDIYEILPPIYLFLYNTSITISGFTLNLFKLFDVIWAVGAVICLCKLCYRYAAMKKYVHSLDKYENLQIYPIVNKILDSYKRPVHFSIVSTEKAASPFVFGILKPYIVLPKSPADNEDLYYILSHEIAHYYHGDLLIKLIIEVIHAICWWNPLFYPIKKQLSALLEINADVKATDKLDEAETISYMQCLLKAAKFRETHTKSTLESSFNISSMSAISKRVNVISNNYKISKLRRSLNIFTATLLLVITLIIPNFFTIISVAGDEPGRVYNPEENGCFQIRKDNAFYIELEDGTYDLYVDRYFIMNLPSTKLIETKIPIYSSLEEVTVK